MRLRDYLRMVEWLLLAALSYTIALNVKQPQLQTLFWKLGHVIIGVFMGYQADVALLGHITRESADLRKIARAIIILAGVFGISGGL